MAAPIPKLDSMTTSPRSPVTGFAVKATPETSDRTMCCTTTAMRTEEWAMPWAFR